MNDSRPLNVWHVSGDFPDPIASDKTAVIRRLVDLTADRFNHLVISINRKPPGSRQFDLPFEHGLALTYAAPPLGLIHATMLNRLGNRIANLTAHHGKPDLLVAHKLTIEGIAVARAANLLGVPYALLVQGNTDCKIIDFRPDLRARLRRLYRGAGWTFHFAPWSRDKIEATLNASTGSASLLPCPTAEDRLLPPRPGGQGFLSVFHLDFYRNKNLAGLARALRIGRAHGAQFACRIAGGGSPAAVRACQAIAAQSPGMELIGHCERAELAQEMNASIAMVLPSKRESFGLAFIESLMAGTPIIYPRHAAVAGYFDNCGFAMPIDPSDPNDIAAAMAHAAANEVELKTELSAWQGSPEFKRFTRDQIAADFARGLLAAASSTR